MSMKISDAKEKIREAGVDLIWEDDIKDAYRGEAYRIIMKISELKAAPNSNAFIQLKEWKKLGDQVIDYIKAVSKFANLQGKYWERLDTDSKSKKYQRWTKEEDEILIELVCSGISQAELSAAMGRTIPAIKTRVSKLVGEKRISQKIAGNFFGTFNGEYVEGTIKGEVINEN